MIKVKEPKEEKFTVVVDFLDLEDNKFLYKAGDVYPRAGLTVSKKRIDFLKSDKNKLGTPVIE